MGGNRVFFVYKDIKERRAYVVERASGCESTAEVAHENAIFIKDRGGNSRGSRGRGYIVVWTAVRALWKRGWSPHVRVEVR